jgi:NAD(P)-dependent dehydrogenase (short-subunit alcohol dehydrogenase family)
MNKQTKRFSNKSVIITGAAGGIGSAMSRRFLAEGAKVCAVDLQAEALDKLAIELGSPAELMIVETDISSEESCKNLWEQVKKNWGAVDVLVNNAGWFPITPFEEISYEEWRKVCAVNLDGTFLVTRAILPLMKSSRAGRIINTSSGSIFAGTPDQCHYVSAKAGVIGFTRSAANALGQYGITVNSITPGLTSTAPIKKMMPKEVLAKQSEARAIKREETADDLVGAICFLASDDAAFITGQTINVDGGNKFI